MGGGGGGGEGGNGLLRFLEQASEEIFKDDLTDFSSNSDICFVTTMTLCHKL
jgi:hypothetical protein